jgi:hypothetical protein
MGDVYELAERTLVWSGPSDLDAVTRITPYSYLCSFGVCPATRDMVVTLSTRVSTCSTASGSSTLPLTRTGSMEHDAYFRILRFSFLKRTIRSRRKTSSRSSLVTSSSGLRISGSLDTETALTIGQGCLPGFQTGTGGHQPNWSSNQDVIMRLCSQVFSR